MSPAAVRRVTDMEKKEKDPYEYQLLKKLVEKYRKSKKDSGENAVHRVTRLNPKDLYKKYGDNDGDLNVIREINDAISLNVKRGFVQAQQSPFSYEFGKVDLVDEQTEAVEAYLGECYGYVSRDMALADGRELVGKYRGRGVLTDYACGQLQAALDRKKVLKDLQTEEDLLKALAFLDRNEEELYLREASMCIYGSSKYFEDNTLGQVSRLVREYRQEPCGEEEMPSEVLEKYRIRIRPQKICLKGDFSLHFQGGAAIEAGALSKGIELDAEDLPKVCSVGIHAERFLTVENRTAYERYVPDQCVIFDLGGYVNRVQRDFLKMVKEACPELPFFHFGDIDAGGFFIHDDLCRKTGIAFGMEHMSAETLMDPQFTDCLQPLSQRDRQRLGQLAKDPRYSETAGEMLKLGVKLEQEIVCLRRNG